ncbi:MAG: RtcB family protein [Pirellulaceae bacterium]|nr:RtcB family protein [Pirellulaceae bacterium]
MSQAVSPQPDASGITVTGEATGIVDLGDSVSPIQVIGTEAIRESFGASCIQQAIAARLAPGVSQLVLNPDAHWGHSVPVGSVMISPTHIYPGPVGVDIKCSMSLLQTDIPAEAIQDRRVRRTIIREIESKLARGRRAAPGRPITEQTGFDAAVQGATKKLLNSFGIPPQWFDRCEDAQHFATDGRSEPLAARLEKHLREKTVKDFGNKCKQLGSYGGGNHFGECQIVRVSDDPQSQSIAKHFGMRDQCVAFLSHCGSRGLGHALATHQFRTLQQGFRKRGRAFPSGEPELVYAEYGSREAEAYLHDMALGANFATVNHLLINSIVLNAFQKVIPGSRGELIYFISHNIARREWVDEQLQWVHRKGATRALPAGHRELQGTAFEQTGHPILLPGNPRDGSSVMVANPGAALTAFSVNHGAGRRLSRTQAKATLTRAVVEQSLDEADVMSNCRDYPIDEAPDAYKDFQEVLNSVQKAGLATEVAKLHATFVIKDPNS